MGEADLPRGESVATPAETKPAIRSGTCETCGQSPAEDVELERVTSYLVLTDVKTIRGHWCPACARRHGLRELLWSTTFGWWGVPLGILAGRAVLKNLNAMKGPGQAPQGVITTFGAASALIPAVVVFCLVAGVQYLSLPTVEELLSAEQVAPPEYVQAVSKGNVAFEAGRFSEAIRHYEEAETHFGLDDALFHNKALALHNLGRTEEALNQLTRAHLLWTRKNGENLIHDHYWILQAQYLRQLGQVDEAQKRLELLAGRTDDQRLYVSLADLLARQARFDEALAILKAGLDFKGPNDVRIDNPLPIQLKRIDVLLQRGDVDAAAAVLAEIQPKPPTTWENDVDATLGAYRNVRLAQGRLDEVRESFRLLAGSIEKRIDELVAGRRSQGEPDQLEVLFRMFFGDVARMRASVEPEPAARRALFEKGLAMSPRRSATCKIGLAQALLAEDRIDEALDALAKLVSAERVIPDLELLQIHGLLLARRYDYAAQEVERLATAYPGRADVQQARAVAAALAAGPERAEAVLAEGRKRLARDPSGLQELLVAEGRLQLHWNRPDEAAKRFRDASEIHPDPIGMIRLQAARAGLESGTTTDADWAFLEGDRAALDARTIRALGRLWRGVARWVQDRDPLEDWTALAKLDPRSFPDDFGWFAVLSARHLVGDLDRAVYEEATRHVLQALRDDRDFVVAVALERTGKREEAEAVYEGIVEGPGLADMPRGLAGRRLGR